MSRYGRESGPRPQPALMHDYYRGLEMCDSEIERILYMYNAIHAGILDGHVFTKDELIVDVTPTIAKGTLDPDIIGFHQERGELYRGVITLPEAQQRALDLRQMARELERL